METTPVVCCRVVDRPGSEGRTAGALLRAPARGPALPIMKLIVAAALAAASLATQAAPDDRWFKAGDTPGAETYIQRGSLELSVFEGAPAASVVGMTISTADNTSVVEKWIIPRKACVDGMGQLHATTLSGEPKRTIEFAFGSGALGAHQAEVICDGYLRLLGESQAGAVR